MFAHLCNFYVISDLETIRFHLLFRGLLTTYDSYIVKFIIYRSSSLLQEHYISHNASVSKRVGLVGRAVKKTHLKEKMAEKQIEARPDGCVVVFLFIGGMS